ncbi:hypothetical protein B0H19DRAFT_1202463 [Mycena capillaripes]|nr:hypothetical protein B0H19DRAFT_1202463 [Mycena capillaripes]
MVSRCSTSPSHYNASSARAHHHVARTMRPARPLGLARHTHCLGYTRPHLRPTYRRIPSAALRRPAPTLLSPAKSTDTSPGPPSQALPSSQRARRCSSSLSRQHCSLRPLCLHRTCCFRYRRTHSYSIFPSPRRPACAAPAAPIPHRARLILRLLPRHDQPARNTPAARSLRLPRTIGKTHATSGLRRPAPSRITPTPSTAASSAILLPRLAHPAVDSD